MLRWKRVEISAGALLLGAALYYLDEQGVLLMAFCACALHELGHWLVIRALGGRVTALRITCVGAEMRLSARCPLGYWQQIAAALAGPAVNLLAARMAAGLGTEGAYCFAGLNLALAAFNLLPAVQLDGGRILWCILALLTSEERAERLLRVLSSALAVGLVLGALLCAFIIYWVLGGKRIGEELVLGRKKALCRAFLPTARYLYVGLAVLVFILSIICGGIG